MSVKKGTSIPKTIHYCWFGRNPLPELALRCIESWRQYLPDYEIKEWNEDNFNVEMNQYVKEAYDAKKYAFVSDFARFWILHKFGGVYFDVDVEVVKSIDDIIDRGAFMGCERDVDARVNPGIGAAAFPEMKIYQELIESYDKDCFIRNDGSLNTYTIVDRTTEVLRRYGLSDVISPQMIEGIVVYPTDYFCPKSFDTGKIIMTENSRSIHWYDASWLPWYKRIYQPIKHAMPELIRSKIQKHTASSNGSQGSRVGIVTFQHDNYGTRLQNFALAYAIKSLGFTPVSIKSDHFVTKMKELVRITQSKLMSSNPTSNKWIAARIKKDVFETFVKRELFQMNVRRGRLSKVADSLSKIIVGSDQIWNPGHLRRNGQDIELFFLSFAPKYKRLAYAPSFGEKVVPDNLKAKYRVGLSGFDNLSVRENDGKSIIKSLVNKDALLMPDPTFLLDSHEWNILTEKFDTKYIHRSYVVVYFLSDQDQEIDQAIRGYSKSKGLEIIYIAGNRYVDGQFIPAPDEFVSLIKNAHDVFTDSFHGTVFSIIHEIPFQVFDRTDQEQSSRIETLLKKYSLEDRYDSDVSVWGMNFGKATLEHIRNVSANEREVGMKYLKRSLN